MNKKISIKDISKNQITVNDLLKNPEKYPKEHKEFLEHINQIMKNLWKPINEMTAYINSLNFEEIKNLMTEFDPEGKLSVEELYKRKDLKKDMPQLMAYRLIDKNGNESQLTAYELGIIILIIYNCKYQNSFNKDEFAEIMYPNNQNAEENFKKLKSKLNKKMRDSFGFELFLREKKGILYIDTKKLPKGNF